MSFLLAHGPSLHGCIERAMPLAASKLKQSDIATAIDGARMLSEMGAFDRRGRVALIECVGPLSYKYDIWSWLFGSSCYAGIAAQVNAAVQSDKVDKIVLYIDSPGGTTHGLKEASDAIFLARQTKDVVAVVDPTAASAAYWLASQATRIVGLSSGWVGSVGAQWEYVSYADALTKAGIDVEVIRSKVSPSKNSAHPYEPIKPEAKKEWQALVDQMGDLFVSHVARGRGIDAEEVRKSFGQGRMLFMDDAIKRGMVDGIGSLAGEISKTK